MTMPRRPRRNGVGYQPPPDHVRRAACDNQGIVELVLYVGGRNLVLTLGGWVANADDTTRGYDGGAASLVPVIAGVDSRIAGFRTTMFADTWAKNVGRDLPTLPPAPVRMSWDPPARDTVTHLSADFDRVVQVGLWLSGRYWVVQFGRTQRGPQGPVLVSNLVTLAPAAGQGEEPLPTISFPLANFLEHWRNLTGSRIELPPGA